MMDHILTAIILSVWTFLLTSSEEVRKYEGKQRRHFRITTILVEPYVMKAKSLSNVTDEIQYEGYIIDLLDLMSTEMKFTYRLAVNSEQVYGHRRSDGTWSGMMGQLYRKEVDIAAAPTFITKHRMKVVHFTRPFMTVHATLLLRKPPTGLPLVITSHKDLLRQSEIRYGTLDRGLIKKALRTANGTARQLFQNMRSFDPSVFTSSNEEGILRVRREKYAFILPDTIGAYIAMRSPCDLITADQFLLNAGYGFALQRTKQGNRLRREINRVLNRLKSQGHLSKLRQKWWIEKNDCVNRSAASGLLQLTFNVLLLHLATLYEYHTVLS